MSHKRIIWPTDMPNEHERSNARAAILAACVAGTSRWGRLRVGTGTPPKHEVVRLGASCRQCDTAWWIYAVLSESESRDRDPRPRTPSTEEQGPCPFCKPAACIAEMQAPTVREVVAAIADTPLVHELAVAADLAQQDGRTTHEQTRHPGDAALIDALLRDADIDYNYGQDTLRVETTAIPRSRLWRLTELAETLGMATRERLEDISYIKAIRDREQGQA